MDPAVYGAPGVIGLLKKECHVMVLGAVKGRAGAYRKRFHPLTAPARRDRGMLVGTKGRPNGVDCASGGSNKGLSKKLAK